MKIYLLNLKLSIIMKETDKYHKWVEWSDEDQVYIGKCPDLISGIHGEDPVTFYKHRF